MCNLNIIFADSFAISHFWSDGSGGAREDLDRERPCSRQLQTLSSFLHVAVALETAIAEHRLSQAFSKAFN